MKWPKFNIAQIGEDGRSNQIKYVRIFLLFNAIVCGGIAWKQYEPAKESPEHDINKLEEEGEMLSALNQENNESLKK
ncbi:unnamed protein product [Blepharisma stoltei]|uniref:Uncharacterized protein n=1 Tax=Blepharisma stoltei TaxID=1481888 RepID=A0AAU9IR80_9CILI|nr:unnamed protein product [Blepharisma stoltei]